MAADWMSQKQSPTETARTRQTVAYLDEEIGKEKLIRLFESYYTKWPEGEQVTLFVLQGIGKKAVEKIAERKAKAKGRSVDAMFNMVKQHLGTWVAINLATYYGAEKVYTFRKEEGISSTRQVPDAFKPDLEWVSSYTPHRITKP